MTSRTSRISGTIAALSLGAVLARGAGSAGAGLVGSTVHPRFYGLDPATLDADAGIIQIADGTSFAFTDPF